ncbi:MAG: TRAP transporter large permease subunit, partial [Alphaproteobacteria bacterium]
VCGSSIATVATMARVALPEMVRRGTERGFAAGTIAAGGTLGVVIPPSVLLVIYALLADQFMLAVFAAAVVPGILAAVMQMLAAAGYARLRPDAAPALERMSWRERWGAVRRAWAVLLLAFVLTAGLYGGVVTVSEAAALGAVAAFLLAVLRGRLSWAQLCKVAEDTALSSGMIYIVIIGAFTFSYFLAVSGLPEALVGPITGSGLPPLAVILLLYLMYLALGAVFDPVAAMVVTLPFVLPVIDGLGYDAVWWGVMLVMVSGLGMITPPIGINVFVLKGLAPGLSLGAIYRGVLPFLAVDLVRLLLLTLFPILATWLPHAMGLL